MKDKKQLYCYFCSNMGKYHAEIFHINPIKPTGNSFCQTFFQALDGYTHQYLIAPTPQNFIR